MVLFGCGKASDAPKTIVGTWGLTIDGQTYSQTYNADLSFTQTGVLSATDTRTNFGTYTYDGTTLTPTKKTYEVNGQPYGYNPNEVETKQVTVSGDSLIYSTGTTYSRQ